MARMATFPMRRHGGGTQSAPDGGNAGGGGPSGGAQGGGGRGPGGVVRPGPTTGSGPPQAIANAAEVMAALRTERALEARDYFGDELPPGARFENGVLVLPPEQIPYQSEWGRKNPGAFRRGYAGAGDTVNAEMRARGAMAARVAAGVAPIDEVLAHLDAENMPVQLKAGQYLAFITAFATPFLLIPYSETRRDFVISNYRVATGSGSVGINGVLFSYGKPVQTAAGELAGIPLTPCFQPTNGGVNLDAIYVFCNDATQTLPIPILGYESGLPLGRSNIR